MKILSKKSLLLSSLIAGLGVSGVTQAGVLAYSNLDIIGIKVLDQNTGFQLVDGITINVTNFTNSSDNLADLDSVAGTAVDTTVSPLLPVDGALVCQGPSCGGIAANDFSEQAPYGGLHFTRGDTVQSGALVDGIVGGGPGGANAQTVAETQLISNDTGQAQGRLELNSTFDFTVSQDTVIAFSFDAGGAVHVINDPDNNIPASNAQASVAFSITITDQTTGNVVFSWAPDGFLNNSALRTELADGANLNFSKTAALAGTDFSDSLAGSFYAHSTAALLAGRQYTTEVVHLSTTNATSDVPEPASLALFGVGLLGLSLRLRKKA